MALCLFSMVFRIMNRILVVEDDPDLLEVIQMLLEENNYKVFPLMNGRPIFRIIEEFRPDIILMDIRLDGMDGRAIFKEIRTRPDTARIPVVLTSGGFSEDYIMRENLLADAYLEKPFEMAVLLDKLQQLLKEPA
ncbi:two-component system alkaline phosphatase synthesis response regulator PhoP/two-component system response regulator VicR [Pedobacter cryoconitis]|uniref:Two-component system alkaline phosphatase synthesis response regulator PhoP/two-component system response regulator VicR n=2 Tax=Pedobacter cryoconitis TaxID=188932 RepID=A0A327SY27_9SPHI|nr:two-component system alkaline phosphatase synthesis response regulator PhoP/two-component system response regulator VicR [Pedobacter cryoconitis]